MTNRLLLVAHAATEATRHARFPVDEPLDKRGAAAAVAERQRWNARAAVLCGPELRCRQTAGDGATVDERLADWSVADWAGRTWDEVAGSEPAAALAWTADPHFAGHGGEPLSALLARVSDYLDQAAAESGSTIAVTSPALLRAAVVQVLDASAEAFWRVAAAPLSRVSLSAYAGRWNLRT